MAVRNRYTTAVDFPAKRYIPCQLESNQTKREFRSGRIGVCDYTDNFLGKQGTYVSSNNRTAPEVLRNIKEEQRKEPETVRRFQDR